MNSEVVGSWLRAKSTRVKRRAKPHVKAPIMAPGQCRIPKPSVAKVIAEREADTAKRIFNLSKEGI